MSEKPRVLQWGDLKEGMTVTVPFRIGQAEMDTFRQLSGDSSRIHIDSEFAQSRGFSGPVVYGALTVARLSHLVGMHLPGDLGLATSWRIDFNRPLYIDEEATFEGELVHVSQSTHTVSVKFRVRVGEKLVATGTAGSKLLDE